jgi:hypothetical protein
MLREAVRSMEKICAARGTQANSPLKLGAHAQDAMPVFHMHGPWLEAHGCEKQGNGGDQP